MRKAHKGRRRKAEREVSRGHSRCGMTEGPNLSRVVSHTCSLRVLGTSSGVSREPAIHAGRAGSPEGDSGVYRTTGDTTNETSSMPRSSRELRSRQEPPYAEPHVRWCGRGRSIPAPYPIAKRQWAGRGAPGRMTPDACCATFLRSRQAPCLIAVPVTAGCALLAVIVTRTVRVIANPSHQSSERHQWRRAVALRGQRMRWCVV